MSGGVPQAAGLQAGLGKACAERMSTAVLPARGLRGSARPPQPGAVRLPPRVTRDPSGASWLDARLFRAADPESGPGHPGGGGLSRGPFPAQTGSGTAPPPERVAEGRPSAQAHMGLRGRVRHRDSARRWKQSAWMCAGGHVSPHDPPREPYSPGAGRSVPDEPGGPSFPLRGLSARGCRSRCPCGSPAPSRQLPCLDS